MDSRDFVEAIKRYVRDAATEDTIANLRNPPGRRVPPEVRARSDWYNGLSEADAAHANSAIAAAAHAGLFGLLAVLDGARTIDDRNGRFELIYVNDQRVLLNPQSIDLHDLLNSSN
jgi:hypothetical protein